MAYDMDEVKDVYEKLTALSKTDLLEEFKARRIKGTEYADVFNSLMGASLQLAMDAPYKSAQIDIAHKELELKEKELEIADAELALKEAQEKLYIRQTEGFDDDLRRKMLDIQMNSWSMMFSSGLLEEKPDLISNDAVSDLYAYMSQGVNVPYYPEGPELVSNGNFEENVGSWTIQDILSAVFTWQADGSQRAFVKNAIEGTTVSHGLVWQRINVDVDATYTFKFEVGESSDNSYVGQVGISTVNTDHTNNVVTNDGAIGVGEVEFIATAPTMYVTLYTGSTVNQAFSYFDSLSVRKNAIQPTI